MLVRTGVHGKMLRMLKSMYSTVQACVRCGSENTEYFKCLQGLKQGCLASPTLFSLFINELAQDIISQGKHGLQFSPNDIEIFIMLFANDIILLSATIAGLQNQITAQYSAANRLRLQLNFNKTKVMVFRKGGHPSARERWYYGSESLEVVNTCRYLGLTSTRFSLKIATDGEHLIRVKRGTIEILKTLRRLNCFSPGFFFTLFDAPIVLSLLYGSKFCGFEPYDAVEKVHIQACKHLLNVPSYIPNHTVLGDLGRFPLFVNSAVRCVQYWFRFLKQPLNRYSRKACEMLYGMKERDCASRNWVAQIKFLLCYNGFGYVWMYGCLGNKKMFRTKFKNRLRDCCSPRWFSHLAKGERFDLYSSFKNILEHERYLEFIQSRLYKTALARFRMGVPRINGHRHRFSVAESRLCPFCIDTIEDECHVLFVCSVYSQLRDRFLLQLYSTDAYLRKNVIADYAVIRTIKHC